MNMKFQQSLYLIILQSLQFWFFKKKSAYFVVTKENMLFSLIGEVIKILFEWKQSLMIGLNVG